LDCSPPPPAPASAKLSRDELNARRESRLAILAALRELGCAGFGNEPFPLAIGIDKDLRALLDGAFTPEAIGAFIHWWVTRNPYLEALSRGDPRRDLDGIVTSEATPEHQAGARRQLDVRARRMASAQREPQ